MNNGKTETGKIPASCHADVATCVLWLHLVLKDGTFGSPVFSTKSQWDDYAVQAYVGEPVSE